MSSNPIIANYLMQKLEYPYRPIPINFLKKSDTTVVLGGVLKIIGKRIYVKFDKEEFLLNFNINIFSKSINNNCPLITNKAEISFIENIDNFSEKDWSNLYKISEKTFVDETDSSKKVAAGAGLTDND